MASRTKVSSDLANVIVLDATNSPLGQRVAASLAGARPGATAPELHAVRPDTLAQAESLAVPRVVRGERRGIVVLDSSTIAGRGMRYAGRNATSIVDVSTLERSVQQSVLSMRLEREGIDAARVQMLTNVKIDAKTQKITDKGIDERAGGMASVIFGYIIAFVLYFMIALYGQAILRGVLEEKTTRVAEVVVSSAKPDTLLGGKVLGVGAVAMTQIVVWITIATLFMRNSGAILAKFNVPREMAASFRLPAVEPGIAVVLLLLFIFGFVFYCALFAAVGAMVSSQEDVNQAQMPVTMLLIVSIIFMQPVLLNPSATFSKVMSWLPFSAPILMPVRMALGSISWMELGLTVLGVALGAAGAIWLSARIYRVGLLMYGKRPSFGEVAKWVRYN